MTEHECVRQEFAAFRSGMRLQRRFVMCACSAARINRLMCKLDVQFRLIPVPTALPVETIVKVMKANPPWNPKSTR